MVTKQVYGKCLPGYCNRPALLAEVDRLQAELARYTGMRTAEEVRGRLQAHRENAARRQQEYDDSGDGSYLDDVDVRMHKVEELEWVLGWPEEDSHDR